MYPLKDSQAIIDVVQTISRVNIAGIGEVICSVMSLLRHPGRKSAAKGHNYNNYNNYKSY